MITIKDYMNSVHTMKEQHQGQFLIAMPQKLLHAMTTFISILLVFTGVGVYAQSGTDETFLKQFTGFSKRSIQEKVFVHTDKEFYLAGEIVWYKIYYMDGAFHQPLDLSKIAYVEILDQGNKPVMQGKNAINNSAAKGSFYLPSSLPSGNFKLRAYTNWMKNSDAEYFFEKNICIINPLKPLNLPPSVSQKTYDVQFFPEGGNLVNGLENRVAFRIVDQNGSGVDCSGMIVNEKNDTILRFQPLKFGMGSFVFTPSTDHTYKAIINTGNANMVTRDLPSGIPTGYIMQTIPDNGNFKVTVTTNLINKANGGEVFLLAHTRQTVKQAERKMISNGSVSFVINKETLEEGISHLTIFNSDQQPVCERLVFKAPVNSLAINAKADAAIFSPRQLVNVDVATVFSGKPASANLSMAIYQVDSVTTGSLLNMQAYLLLASDLKGGIESPEFYFSGDPSAGEAIDNLMMTQGWRRFNWNQPFRKTALAPVFPPEFDGHLVAATVTYNNKQQPAAGVKAYLSVPGTKTQFYPSVTDQDGKAWFDIRDYYGKNEVIVQTEPLADSNYRIDIADPFSDRYSIKTLPALNFSAAHRKDILNRSLSMQALNAFMNDSLTRFDIPVLDSNPFYGRYTKMYLLDDYVRFTTMEEVLREYVPEVGIKRTGGQPRVRISDWDQLRYLDGEPLLLLDGVPVTHKQLLAYDPMKVRKLEVVTNRYITGKFVFDGIASFNSYAGNMPEFQFDPKTVILDYEGLQLEREFYSPVYDTDLQKKSRIADFRNTLTWQPDLQTNISGKTSVQFYTSDRPGKFLGVIHGIDNNGHAATQTISFEVKK